MSFNHGIKRSHINPTNYKTPAHFEGFAHNDLIDSVILKG